VYCIEYCDLQVIWNTMYRAEIYTDMDEEVPESEEGPKNGNKVC